MYANLCFWTMVLLAIAWPVWRQYLNHLDYKSTLSGPPKELEGLYDGEKQQKALAFKRDNYRFGTAGSWCHVALLLALLFTGFYGWLADLAARVPGGLLVQTPLVFAAQYLIQELIGVPFGYYHRFVLMERHGFNRSTKKLFWLDALKSLPLDLLGAVAEPLWAAALYLLFEGKWFWWPVMWITSYLGGLFINTIYPMWIAPLFNKFTPLPDGELKERAKALAASTGTRFKNIYVADTSKRHSMANAYFTGVGRWRRCVLFDVLLKDYTDDEILAILAHEIGHYKQKGLRLLNYTLDFLLAGLGYFVLAWLVGSDSIAQALGGGLAASFCLGFIALQRLWRPLQAWLTPMWVAIGRRMEYDADAESVRQGFGPAQIAALKRLYKNNLGSLNRHPLWVTWSDPHPTLLQRVQFMEKMEQEREKE